MCVHLVRVWGEYVVSSECFGCVGAWGRCSHVRVLGEGLCDAAVLEIHLPQIHLSSESSLNVAPAFSAPGTAVAPSVRPVRALGVVNVPAFLTAAGLGLLTLGRKGAA